MSGPSVVMSPNNACQIPITFLCTFTPVLPQVQLPNTTPEHQGERQGNPNLTPHPRPESFAGYSFNSNSYDLRSLSTWADYGPEVTATTSSSSYSKSASYLHADPFPSVNDAQTSRQSMRNTPLKQHDLPTEARTVHPSHEPVKDDDTSVALSPDTPPLILFDDHPTQEPGPQMDVPSHTHPHHPMNPVPPSIPESGHHSPRRHDIPSEDQPNEALTQFKILNNVLRNRFNLTNLEIDPSISTDTFRLILSRTPSLRSINVKLKSISSSGPKSGYPMLDHPSLEELTINTTVHPGQLLTSLCLPRLSQFSLNAHKGTFAREEELGLYKLLRTSQCFLSSLSLVDVYPRQSELIHCLLHRTCQTLQILKVCSTISPLVATTFRRRCIMNPTIKVLGDTTTTGEPLICPRLLLLELSHCDASNDLFAEMVKTRVGAGPLSLGYAFRSPSPQFDAAIREKLAAIRTPYPFRFRSMFTHVITKDISI